MALMSDEMVNDEKVALLSHLNAQRHHVLGSLDGLSEADLRRPVLPSGWSCLGLVQHLALDVERFWFRALVAGETVDLKSGAEAWQVPTQVSSRSVFASYREEIRLADAVITRTSLDAMPLWWPPDLAEQMAPQVLRRTVLHVITETACHAGHLDAARELLDGGTWLILTD